MNTDVKQGPCIECGVEGPLDNNDKCSVCGTKTN